MGGVQAGRPGAAGHAPHMTGGITPVPSVADGHHNPTRVDALKKGASDCRAILGRAEDQLEGATGKMVRFPRSPLGLSN